MGMFDGNGDRVFENNVFNGKTASFYGDSLTETNYHYTKGYHSWVKDIIGLSSYQNYGHSGYKISDVCTLMASATDNPDIVFVMIGVNDQTYNTPLGQMGDTTTDTIYGGFDVLCNTIEDVYPDKLTIFITPHYQTNYPHTGGITSYEISRAMIEVATKYSIPVYDNFVMSGMRTGNLSVYTTDNCHWNNTGHEMVGKNLADWILSNFGFVYQAPAQS